VGQCNVPATVGWTKVSAGYDHAMALRQDGFVTAWGDNAYGECNVPPDLGPCTAVSAGNDFSVAVRQDGIVRAWGNNNSGQCNPPSNLTQCMAVAAGIDCIIALVLDPLDRNSNGILDSVEIAQNPTLDRNNNGILDSWELANIVNADRNSNGIIDLAEIATLTASNAALTARLNCGDLDGDGAVNGADLGRMLISWGQCQ
jgi:hypothetical protein